MSDLLARVSEWLSSWFPSPPVPDPGPTPTPLPDPQPPAPPVPPTPAPTTTLVVRALNAARSAEGLPAMVEDPPLCRVSADWAATMRSMGQIDHGDFADRIGAIYPDTAAGENIAKGQPDPASVVDAWMDDPPHRANILGDFDRVGVGMARDDQGSIYWCADFVKLD